MARTKDFDPDIILDRAINLFWERGYEKTSVQDLVNHLGIGRGSLYNAFGDKHSLFLAALKRYRLRAPARIRRVLRDFPVKQALRQLFYAYIEEIVTDPLRRGCFIINSTTELAARDPEVAQDTAASRMAMIEAFKDRFTQAQKQGEVSAEKDPLALAEFFHNTMQGLRVQARNDPDRKCLERIVDVALSVFD